MGRWFPRLGSGGAAGAADSGMFDWLKTDKVDWKKAFIAGSLGGLLAFGGGFFTDHGLKLVKALPRTVQNWAQNTVVNADGTVSWFAQQGTGETINPIATRGKMPPPKNHPDFLKIKKGRMDIFISKT